MSNKFLTLTQRLLGFNTYEDNEHIMYDFVKAHLQSSGFSVKQDELGNIYCTRGKASKYPLLNAHMDIVFDIDTSISKQLITSPTQSYNTKRYCGNCQNIYDCAYMMSEDEQMTYQEALDSLQNSGARHNYCEAYIDDMLYETNKYSYTFGSVYTKDELAQIDSILDKEYTIQYDSKTGFIKSNKLRILGGDDKCGMAIAMQLAKETRCPMKILFTTGEETGCIGISYFCKHNAKWFNDVKYSLTIDRRGNDNLIMRSCGKANCSADFAGKVACIGIQSGIQVKLEEGTIADVIYIRNHVAECVNMSAGYFIPHSVDEYVDFFGMYKVKNWITNIIENI